MLKVKYIPSRYFLPPNDALPMSIKIMNLLLETIFSRKMTLFSATVFLLQMKHYGASDAPIPSKILWQ